MMQQQQQQQQQQADSKILHFEDLDIKGNTNFDGFADQELRNHPATTDQVYRRRRRQLIDLAMASVDGLPVIEYTETEIGTWGTVLRAMKQELPSKVCREYNDMFHRIGFREDQIPCLPDISARLHSFSGWRLHVAGGYMEPRIFLNCLAFRTFPVIPFVRHHDEPFYSIEPDICHELLGHVPMLADKDFGELCYQIGRASLNASDELIGRLGNVYWHFVEFGLVWEKGERKAFGAAVVSCIKELYNAMDGEVEVLSFDPEVCEMDGEHPVTLVQPYYYSSAGIEHAKLQVQRYVNKLLSANSDCPSSSASSLPSSSSSSSCSAVSTTATENDASAPLALAS